MKKLVKIFIFIVIFSFVIVLYITNSDKNIFNKTKREIIEKTDIKEIIYYNEYDNYYLVMDKKYLYVFDDKYNELLKIDRILIHRNDNNYDIIYKNGQVVYLSDELKKEKLIYKYYDLYTYELINEIVLGG